MSAMVMGPMAAMVLIAPGPHGSVGCGGPGTPWL